VSYRKTGFTIAPEAGSQRLRDIINKNIGEDDIKDTVRNAFELGWQVIKLYFMIGLPAETDDDLQAMVDLVMDLRRLRGPKNHRSKINVSLATFIPKPHTPFQWAAQNSLAESREKLGWIKSKLNLPGIHVKWQDPQVSLIEGLWSRGDRKLFRLLLEAYDRGCKFDGWSDNFRFSSWLEACRGLGIDIDLYTARVRDLSEPLPWDHIDTRVEKQYLRQEWARALKRELTDDCRGGECNRCGVCDFDSMAPQVFQTCNPVDVNTEKQRDHNQPHYTPFKISYSKTGQAKYFGHLEMVKIFLRAFRRAQIPVKHSEGFHPKPKVSFGDSLPVGMESTCEHMVISVAADFARQMIVDDLNKNLPDGLTIHDCLPVSGGTEKFTAPLSNYEVTIHEGQFDENIAAQFLQKTEFFITRTHRKGKRKKIDLRSAVVHLEVLSSNRLHLTLKSGPGLTLRPGEVLKRIFRFSESQIRCANIIKSESDHPWG
jgi:radical SAM-linked protein